MPETETKSESESSATEHNSSIRPPSELNIRAEGESLSEQILREALDKVNLFAGQQQQQQDNTRASYNSSSFSPLIPNLDSGAQSPTMTTSSQDNCTNSIATYSLTDEDIKVVAAKQQLDEELVSIEDSNQPDCGERQVMEGPATTERSEEPTDNEKPQDAEPIGREPCASPESELDTEEKSTPNTIDDDNNNNNHEQASKSAPEASKLGESLPDEYHEIVAKHLAEQQLSTPDSERLSQIDEHDGSELLSVSSLVSPYEDESTSQLSVSQEADKHENHQAGGLDGTEETDFCGEMASSSTLRRLKRDTFEDVLVCEQSRESTASAKRLFDSLIRQSSTISGRNGRFSAPLSRTNDGRLGKKSGSLSSQGEQDDEDVDEEILMAHKRSQNQDLFDVKLVRRSGSSASSCNFRQTLVCSVSPTNQHQSEESLQDQNQVYPINDDEIVQCRQAFRENKRLIQEKTTNFATIKTDSSMSLSAMQNNQTKLLNADHFQKHIQALCCSHCNKRLYPVDKMELDFTKTKLNIHRNCFKCQICSSMLR